MFISQQALNEFFQELIRLDVLYEFNGILIHHVALNKFSTIVIRHDALHKFSTIVTVLLFFFGRKNAQSVTVKSQTCPTKAHSYERSSARWSTSPSTPASA